MKNKDTYEKVLSGKANANIPFSDLRKLILGMGFDERVAGSHHIFAKSGVEEFLNLQPKGDKAKPYQVKQVRNVILKYGLRADDDV